MKSQSQALTTTKKASFWKRLIAFSVDYILYAIISRFLGVIFNLPDTIEYWIYFMLFYAYNIFMDYHYQGTLGKMILKIKVIKTDGTKPDLLSAFYRNIGKIVSSLPLFYGFLRILDPNQKQTIHDQLGKCFVTEA